MADLQELYFSHFALGLDRRIQESAIAFGAVYRRGELNSSKQLNILHLKHWEVGDGALVTEAQILEECSRALSLSIVAEIYDDQRKAGAQKLKVQSCADNPLFHRAVERAVDSSEVGLYHREMTEPTPAALRKKVEARFSREQEVLLMADLLSNQGLWDDSLGRDLSDRIAEGLRLIEKPDKDEQYGAFLVALINTLKAAEML